MRSDSFGNYLTVLKSLHALKNLLLLIKSHHADVIYSLTRTYASPDHLFYMFVITVITINRSLKSTLAQ